MYSSSDDASHSSSLSRHSGSSRASRTTTLPSPSLSRASDGSSHSSPTYTPANPPYTTTPASAAASNNGKKKHVCPTCDRPFTTSGHLARHARVHTGERNHKCPFPGCETRCSRQDNLQQHYRIHLSPGSRRRSASATRQAMTLAMGSSGSAARRRSRNGASTPSSDAPDTPPSLGSSQQSLGDAAAALIPEPPETPPPLAEARLPIFPLGSSGSAPDQCMVSYFPASAHSQDDRGVSSSYAGQNSAGHSPSWEYRNGSTYSYPGQEHVGGSHTSYDYGDADQTTSSSGANGQSYGLGQTSFNTYPSSSAYTRGETTPLGVHSPLTFGSSTRPPLAHNSQAQPSPLSAHSPLSSQPPTPTYSSSSSISGHITPHDVDMDAGSGSPLIHRHSSDLPLSSRYSSHSTLSGAGGYSQRISSSAAEDPTIAELTLPAVNTFSVPPSPAQHRYPHSYPDSQSIQTHFGAGSRGDDSRYSAVILPPIHEDRGHSRDQRRRYTDPTYSDDYDRRDTLGSNYSLVSQTHSPVTTSSSSYSQYSSEYDRGYLVQDSGFRSNLVHSST